MSRSSLARPLDPSYPSNRLAALGLAVTTLAAKATGKPWRGALASGLGAFLAWSAARELHPDDENAANVALVLGAGAALLSPPSIPTAFGQMAALRVVAGTVGEPVTPVDEAALAVLGGVSAAGGSVVTAFMMPTASMLTVGVGDRLSPPPPYSAITAVGLVGPLGAEPLKPTGNLRWVVLGLLAATVGLLNVPTPQTRQDNGNERVNPERVLRARLLAMATLGATALVEGDAGVRRSSPLLAAWLGTALTALVWSRVRK